MRKGHLVPGNFDNNGPERSPREEIIKNSVPMVTEHTWYQYLIRWMACFWMNDVYLNIFDGKSDTKLANLLVDRFWEHPGWTFWHDNGLFAMVCFFGVPAVRPKDVDMFTVRLQLTEGGERWIVRDVELLSVWKDFPLIWWKYICGPARSHDQLFLQGLIVATCLPCSILCCRRSPSPERPTETPQLTKRSWWRARAALSQPRVWDQPWDIFSAETLGLAILGWREPPHPCWQVCRAPLSPVKVCWLRNTDRLQKEHGAVHSVADLPQPIPKPLSSLSLKYNSLNMWLWASPPYLASAGVFTTHYLLKLTWDLGQFCTVALNDSMGVNLKHIIVT